MRCFAIIVCFALLAGCTTISANPARDALASSGKVGTTVQQGLLDASSNLDQAIAVGALDKADPAAACLHGVLQQLGIDPTLPVQGPGTSFTPKISDLISLGSVLYIRAQQLQKLQGAGVITPPSCKALIGQFVLDAAAAGVRNQPGGGLPILLR
jgi:hypothetical protein